jgi:hypothetical protein
MDRVIAEITHLAGDFADTPMLYYIGVTLSTISKGLNMHFPDGAIHSSPPDAGAASHGQCDCRDHMLRWRVCRRAHATLTAFIVIKYAFPSYTSA